MNYQTNSGSTGKIHSPTFCRAGMALLTAGFLGGALDLSAQNAWNGASLTTSNWSDSANWSYAMVPASTEQVLFNLENKATNAAGVVDNIVDQNFNVTGLTYQTLTTNGYHTTLINPGLSLNITGGGANAYGPFNNNSIWVGSGFDPGNNRSLTYRIVGNGTLSVTNPTGAIIVAQTRADDNDHRANFELQGLTNFNAVIGQILIGSLDATATAGDRPHGQMILAETNVIVTAAGVAKPAILVGGTGTANRRGPNYLYLGQVNTVFSDAITIGGYKSDGRMLFRSGITAGTLTLRGSAGGADKVKLLTVGDMRAYPLDYVRSNSGITDNGVLDLTGGTVDALVQDLYIGRSQTNGTGSGVGTLTFEAGTILADNLFMGYHHTGLPATGQTTSGTGTLNINGNGTFTVNNDVILARKLGATVPVATINLSSNGLLNVKGNIVGGGNSTLNFANGGKVDMQPAGDATPGTVTVSTLSGNGIITNTTGITVTNALSPGGVNTAGTLALSSNLTLNAGATLAFNLGNSSVIGGGQNDYVNLLGNFVANNNLVTINPTAPLAGTYRLIDFTGTGSGSLTLTNTTRYTLALDQATPRQVNLSATGSSLNLAWAGAGSLTNWNYRATTNWNASTESFYQGDSVSFADGAATNVNVSGTLYPTAISVNTESAYYFLGTGKISGGTGITKTGAGTLWIGNSGGNDFSGSNYINAGKVITARGDSLGSSAAGTVVANGATLDVAAQNLGTEHIIAGGAGVDGLGAISSSTGSQNNALRFVTLTGNTTFGGTGRWDIRAAGTPATAELSTGGNAYNLIKTGANQVSLVSSVVDPALGDIDVQQGIFSFELNSTSLGNPANELKVASNATFQVWAATNLIDKKIVLNGGVLLSGSGSNTIAGQITLASPSSINANSGTFLYPAGDITGPGMLIKGGAGTLIIDSPKSYTGETLISAGRLALSSTGSLNSSPAIAVNAVLDVSAASSFTLPNGQTLSGSGTIVGNLTAGSGNMLVPGTSAGTLTFSNNLTLNAANGTFELSGDPLAIGGNTNDLIVVQGTLTLQGETVIKIIPLATLSTTEAYTILLSSNLINGSVSNLKVTSDSRYTFTPTIDNSTLPAAIKVTVSGSGSSASLVWKGNDSAAPNAWDTKITPNWLNGASPDIFFLGDNVRFDDTSDTGIVNLAGSLQPAAVVFDNSSKAYALGGTGELLAGSVYKQNQGTVTVANNADNVMSSLVISNGVVNLANNGGTALPGGASVYGGALNIQQPVSPVLNQPLTLGGGVLGFDQTNNVTFAGALRDDGTAWGAVEKRGPNVLTLSANNTNFNGPILVNQGTLRLGNTDALGSGVSGTTVANGAALDVNGTGIYQRGETIVIVGVGPTNGGAIVNGGAAQNNAVSTVILSNNAAVGAWGNRFDIRGPGGSGSLSGSLILNGYTLTKLGPGRVSLVDLEVPGDVLIDIQGGVFDISRCNVVGPGVINLRNKTLLLESYTAGSLNTPLVSSGGILQCTSANFAIGSPITNLAGLTLDSSAILTHSSGIYGPAALMKTGSGTNILTTSDNDWSGSTTIAAGTLQVGNNGVGRLPNLPMTNNATLFFYTYDDNTNSFEISGSGAIRKLAPGILTIMASNSYTGVFTAGSGSPSPDGTMGGVIRLYNSYGFGNGVKNVDIVRSRLELYGPLDLPTNITLRTSSVAELGGSGVGMDYAALVNMSGNNVINGQMVLTSGGGSSEYRVESGQLTINGGISPNTTSRTLILSGSAPGIINGALTNNGANIPALTKRGGNTWTLNASNDFTGATTVQEGTLTLGAGGSLSRTPTITMRSNATLNVAALSDGFMLNTNQTLRGNGNIIGPVSSDGIIAPGETGAGALHFSGALLLTPLSTVQMELDKQNGTNDSISAASVTFNGTLTVSEISGVQPTLGDTFKLFHGGYAGGFTSVNLPALTGNAWDIRKLGVDGTISVVPAMNYNPTNITYSVSGNTLTIAWPEDYRGWELQSQTNEINVGLSTTWYPVPGSTATNQVQMNMDTTKGTVFFRLFTTKP